MSPSFLLSPATPRLRTAAQVIFLQQNLVVLLPSLESLCAQDKVEKPS